MGGRRTAGCWGVRRQAGAKLPSSHVWRLPLGRGVSVSFTISAHTPSTVIFVFETGIQPPQVAPVPRCHFCAMHLDHMRPQVHFSGEHDQLLFGARALFAWEVILQKVRFLEFGLAEDQTATNSNFTSVSRFLKLRSDQPSLRTLQGYSLFMWSPLLFAHEAFFMPLPHVCVKCVVVVNTFVTKLAHWMNFHADVCWLLWCSTESNGG